MFSCKTKLYCDICGKSLSTSGEKMSDCLSRAWFERISKTKHGWHVVYGRYHVCKECFEHYGRKYIYSLFKKKEVEENA